MLATAMPSTVAPRAMYGPMLGICPYPGCTTVTMGGTCVEHDAPVNVDFPRGRPFVTVRDEKRHAVTAG